MTRRFYWGMMAHSILPSQKANRSYAVIGRSGGLCPPLPAFTTVSKTAGSRWRPRSARGRLPRSMSRRHRLNSARILTTTWRNSSPKPPPITAPCRSGIMPPCSRKWVSCWKLSTLSYKTQLATAERKSPGFPGDFYSFTRGTLRFGPRIVCLAHPPSRFVIA